MLSCFHAPKFEVWIMEDAFDSRRTLVTYTYTYTHTYTYQPSIPHNNNKKKDTPSIPYQHQSIPPYYLDHRIYTSNFEALSKATMLSESGNNTINGSPPQNYYVYAQGLYRAMDSILDAGSWVRDIDATRIGTISAALSVPLLKYPSEFERTRWTLACAFAAFFFAFSTGRTEAGSGRIQL
ncbi:hypothetical protein GALMADRAFT_146835 [Galerina marginata CBS 339.88]|uniref:Uncharacterized protein n=1 Tax=Galerina marginata (strain CBS 339.88) TaxID=685588 RepID=A0A067SJB0_GALM3|nr:hypothetical protein GALMADRAFT_146835 [Galerina marginata CBS 339.88]